MAGEIPLVTGCSYQNSQMQTLNTGYFKLRTQMYPNWAKNTEYSLTAVAAAVVCSLTSKIVQCRPSLKD